MGDGFISKAAILTEINKPLVVEDIMIPAYLDTGQVLVCVHVSGICGAQLGEIAGAAGKDPYLPHLLGHEGGGEVIETGAGVTNVKVGDHVVMHWRPGPGIEANFPKYLWSGGNVGGGRVTTFNEYAVVSENRLTRIDIGIPYDIAALMGCAVTTGLGIINNEAELKMGRSIAVIGCGGVGLIAVQGAAMISAHPIYALDIHTEKLRMAKEFGATNTIDLSVCQNTDGEFDVVIECTGLPEMIRLAYSMVARGGKAILVGQPHYEQTLTLYNMRKYYSGKTMLDSQGGLTDPAIDIPRYLKLYRAEKLRLDELITHRFPLIEVNKAIDVARSGKAGRVILEMKDG